MLDLLNTVWEWFTSNLTGIWLAIILGAVFLPLFRMSWSPLAGWDVKWDKRRFREDHPRSNWLKSTARRYSWLRLGVLYYLLWVGAVVLWVNGGFSWLTYFTIATIWLLAAPLRNIWLITTVRQIFRKRGEEPVEIGLWEQVSQYYEKGFYLPQDRDHEPWFKGRASFLNFFQKFRFLVRILRMWRILGQVIVSLVWPITMAIAPYYHMGEAEEYDPRPWWRLNRHG